MMQPITLHIVPNIHFHASRVCRAQCFIAASNAVAAVAAFSLYHRAAIAEHSQAFSRRQIS